MSETRDKRRRNDLDLFVLALIESGVSTPYELKTAAGLSPGATIPALTRLIKARFILQGRPGPRGRMDHKITATGRKYLNSDWRALLDDGPSGDLDADLRVALLAFWVGGDRRLAADFLRKSAAHKLESTSTAEGRDESASLPPLALWYQRLRSTSAEILIKGESAAALAMAKALPRRPARKQKQVRSTPKSLNRAQGVPKGPRGVFVDPLLPQVTRSTLPRSTWSHTDCDGQGSLHSKSGKQRARQTTLKTVQPV